MVVSYPPEGRLLHTPGNQAACQSLHTLAQAQAKQTILEGRTILCTPEHDLQVQLGPFTGVIPREETALGIREGTVREIAILSRVGKPTMCMVSSILSDGTLLLSRRQAQERTLAALLDRPLGTVLPGTITHLAPFGAFVDIGVHQDGLVHISKLTDKKFVKHPLDVVSVGDVVDVKVLQVDMQKKRIQLSMIL